MAKNKCTVYLGFEDELINEKNKSLVDFTTNKIGGQADWPFSGITVPDCPFCGLRRFLIAQLYAPIDTSQFHRTLYIFTCLNAVCSNQSDSWLCVRSQILEMAPAENDRKTSAVKVQKKMWLSGADEWDDDEEVADIVVDDNSNEENGNLINDNRDKISDEDDETNSNEFDPIPFFCNLNVNTQNANFGAAQGGGAIGNVNAMNASAEIEGEESEVIIIDTPVTPQRDLVALMKQTVAIPTGNLENVALRSFFVAVDEERSHDSSPICEHVRDLIHNYQVKDGAVRTTPTSPENETMDGGAAGTEAEQYEKANPAHGDLMFHEFLSRIGQNPGQLIRYSRDAAPVLIRPIGEEIPRCRNCGKDVICEVQILPSLISKLQLENGDITPIEFGNVLIFTCKQSCWDTPDKFRFEFCLVQQEL